MPSGKVATEVVAKTENELAFCAKNKQMIIVIDTGRITNLLNVNPSSFA